jgi:hypothetical protein
MIVTDSEIEELTEKIIGWGIEVHRNFGPGYNSTTLKAGLKRLDHPDRYGKKAL